MRDWSLGARVRLGDVLPEAGRVCELSDTFHGVFRLSQVGSASDAAASAPDPERPEGNCSSVTAESERVSYRVLRLRIGWILIKPLLVDGSLFELKLPIALVAQILPWPHPVVELVENELD